eukprot:1633486-Pleurochrysis_carterae.AAC.3
MRSIALCSRSVIFGWPATASVGAAARSTPLSCDATAGSRGAADARPDSAHAHSDSIKRAQQEAGNGTRREEERLQATPSEVVEGLAS